MASLILGDRAGAQTPAPSRQGTPPAFSGGGTIITPESSVEHPGDAGVRAHTNIKIFVPAGNPPGGRWPEPKAAQVTQGCNKEAQPQVKPQKEEAN